jgi:histone acetyltransferase (RNA polymerase elongator complex component)
VKINGRETDVTNSDIVDTIEEYLEILPKESIKEVAFFGGTFTGIDKRIQEEYLATVKPYIESGLVDGIRLSTRPDYINEKILDLQKNTVLLLSN